MTAVAVIGAVIDSLSHETHLGGQLPAPEATERKRRGRQWRQTDRQAVFYISPSGKSGNGR